MTVSQELRTSPIVTGKLVNLEIERRRRELDDAVQALVVAVTEQNLTRVNIAREALRDAGGLP